MELIWIGIILAAFAYDISTRNRKKTEELEKEIARLQGKPLEEVIKPTPPTEKYQWGRKDKEIK